MTTWLARVRTASGAWRQTPLRIRVGPGTLDLLVTRNVVSPAGAPVTVDALVRDAAGRPLRGVAVKFSASAGATASPAVGTTDARGVAVSSLAVGSAPAGSAVTLVARASPLVASTTLTVATQGTLTVATAPGGVIAPSGTGTYPIGSMVDVAITPEDPTAAPGVMVDGVTVPPTPPTAGSPAWHVAVSITGANRVDVSYAHLAPLTEVADAKTGGAFVSVAPGGSSIRFASLTPFLEGLAPGDILATSPAAASTGMPPVLLRIAAVNRDGPGVAFATVPAKLTDAIQSATLDAHLALVEQVPAAVSSTSAAMSSTSAAMSSTSAAILAEGITLGGSVAVGGWGDDVSTQIGPITVTGSYGVSGPTLNIATTIGLRGVQSFRATLSETVSASIALDGGSKSASTERTLAHHAFNSDIVLGAIVVPVVTSVDAGAGAESQLGLAFHTKVGINGTLEAGVAYTTAAGWSLIGDENVTFPFDPPTTPALTGRVRGYPFLQVTPAIGFSYGIGPIDVSLFCGPYAKAQLGFLELAGDTSANPWAWLDGGVAVSGGARCSFGDPKQLANVELVRKRLWDSGGPTPTPTPAPTPGSITCTATGSMLNARADYVAARLLDGRVLFAGGWAPPTAPPTFAIATAELFDPATGAFSSTGAMSAARVGAAAATLPDGRVLIVGGWGDAGVSGPEVYDPSLGVFRTDGNMSGSGMGATATRLLDGRVLVTGGMNANPLASAAIYDPTTGRFTPTGSMFHARYDHEATLLVDGRVLITGGLPTAVSSTAEIYDPSSSTFTLVGPMFSSRAGQTATLMNDGRVLIAGGGSARSEIFDPLASKFAPSGAMSMVHISAAAAVLPDGRVLVAGGYTGQNVDIGSVEVFDPATGLFAPAGSLSHARYATTAISLADGRILIAGGGISAGGNAPSIALASADICSEG